MGLKINLIQVIKYLALNLIFIMPMTISIMTLRTNQYFQTLFYLLGLCILFFVHLLIAPLIGHARNDSRQKEQRLRELYLPVCNLTSLSTNSAYTCPAWSSGVLSYSTMYLLLPIFINGYKMPVVLMILSALGIIIDGVVRIRMGCYGLGAAGLFDVLCGIFFGGIIGLIWYMIVKTINPNFTITDTVGKMTKCEKQGKMKCNVIWGPRPK